MASRCLISNTEFSNRWMYERWLAVYLSSSVYQDAIVACFEVISSAPRPSASRGLVRTSCCASVHPSSKLISGWSMVGIIDAKYHSIHAYNDLGKGLCIYI